MTFTARLRSARGVSLANFGIALLLSVGTATTVQADELLQQMPKLVGDGAVGAAVQGAAVAISADGSTALVGGAGDDMATGAVWVWARPNGVWTRGPKLVASGAIGVASQGAAVSLSGDGRIALVGAPSDNGGIGAAWVWTRTSDDAWIQGPKLVGAGAVGQSQQGFAVALSADGKTALVASTGAVWVWVQNGSSWAPQGNKLVPAGVTGAYSFGRSVALSADGDRALIGMPSYNELRGTAWVFTRTNGSWSQESALTGAFVPEAQVGWSVALSADGTTALIGGPGGFFDGEAGAALVYVRNNGVWTLQESLGGYDEACTRMGNPRSWYCVSRGSAVALSADGNTALVGGPKDGSRFGAVWLFKRTGDTWRQQGSKLRPADWNGAALVGTSVGLSADGGTAIVGGPNDASGVGAAWIFSTTSATPGDVDVHSDFDGDGRSDFAVYRPTTGEWFIRYSSLGYVIGAGTYRYQWGLPGDIPLITDFDGDRKTDLTVYRPSTGEWFIRYSSLGYGVGAGNWLFQWGLIGDLPIVGDFDGDGKTDLTVYRPSTGEWYLRYSGVQYVLDANTWYFQWGLVGDIPVAADFDGDGKTDLAVYRPAAGGTADWFIRNSSFGYAIGSGNWHFQWGLSRDRPELADFDGDGKIDLTVYRPGTGEWFVRYSSLNYVVGAGTWHYQWGLIGDTPMVEDFDGDGRSELTVYRPSTGEWFVRFSGVQFVLDANTWYYRWGLPGDTPLPSN
jgi:hypothetical protein